MYKDDLALNTDNGWYATKLNETKVYLIDIYV